MANFFEMLFGGADKMKKFDQMDPQQLQFLKSIFSSLSGGSMGQGNEMAMQNLMEMLNPSQESFDKFADPYKRQFEQETVPMLAERFAGMGGGMGGGLSSSGFGQALSSAGGNLQSNLASLKSNLAQNAAGQLMGQYGRMAGMGMGAQPFGYQYQQGGMGMVPMGLAAWAGQGFPGIGG